MIMTYIIVFIIIYFVAISWTYYEKCAMDARDENFMKKWHENTIKYKRYKDKL